MYTIVRLYSNVENEIARFLQKFYQDSEENTQKNTQKNTSSPLNLSKDTLEWEHVYENPIEIADIIGIFAENSQNYPINMWISMDKDIFINVTEQNADEIIRYLYERFPY